MADAPSTLAELLRWRAARQPHQLAWTFLTDGDREESSLTYLQLDRQAASIARRLREQKAEDERVLILCPPGKSFISAFFGCLYAGAIAVPAYPPRLNHNLARMQSIVYDAQPSIALTSGELLKRLQTSFAVDEHLRKLVWLDADAPGGEESPGSYCHRAQSSDLAFLQYTSGSTGAPKGVMLSHENLLHNAGLVYQACLHTSSDRYFSWLPAFHDMGFMAGVLQPLYAGIPAVLMSPASFLQRPVSWLQAISRYRATTSGAPNFAFDLCARKIKPEQLEGIDLSSWTIAFNGAEPVREETLRRFNAAFEPFGFRPQAFYPCYGLAEATLMVSGSRKLTKTHVASLDSRALEEDRVVEAESSEEQSQSFVGCGEPLPGQKVLIVHPETLMPCSPSEVGEIWVSGASVAKGYWGRPDESERTFNARLATDGSESFLRTGDLGFLSRGQLYITGRLKDLIILRGRNLYPHDIEWSVERSHPALRQYGGAAFSVVVEGEERLCIVQEIERRRHAEAATAIESIRRAVAESHEAAVHTVVLIKAGSLPKTSSGKVQRHVCRQRLQAGSLETVLAWHADAATETDAADRLLEASFEATFQTARDIERWLVSEVASKYQVDPASIEVDQPLDRYGLDSLAAVELLHSVERRFGVSLSAHSFLDSPIISRLSVEILSRLPGVETALETEPLEEDAEQTTASLSFNQKSLWFLRELEPESPAYNIARAVRFRNGLDVSALRAAFQSLVERHPSLRTTFVMGDGEPLQRIGRRTRAAFEVLDASGWSKQAFGERLSAEARMPFNLEQGPLLRVMLFERGAHEYVMLLVVHHIITDLWSLGVLMRELSAFYEAERSSHAATLSRRAVPYTNFVRWQTEMLRSAEGERWRSYWLQQLGDGVPALELPSDRPRMPAQTSRGQSVQFTLDTDTTRRLRDLGRASGATLYMVLMAAFQTLLYRYTGQEDFAIGSPVSGRSRAKLAGLVGYLVNMIAIRARLSGSQTYRELLATVRQTALEAFEHQDYPFSLLVEQLQAKRNQSRSPIFQVMFALQNVYLEGEDNVTAFALGDAGVQLRLGSLEMESIGIEQTPGQFDLSLIMVEAAGELRASLEYNAELFESDTIRRMAQHFQVLLESILSNPERLIADFNLLTAEEQRRQVYDWNDTATDYPAHLCIHQLFESQASRTPHAVALCFDNQQLTYAELNARA
ncbi:MAG TPA: condensation domain-containing protein, partial [Pyrinomonadaceae bacterium]|nr:condensation domain-containing protein [Pyrinomonadaceae bacterium]